eukprot:Nitzschia sp. Nitz4//scaffold159_size51929//1114//2819//NITZ4_006869-RA/size51929-processed-gene-0.11-mRNA-1//-1//CDS//3329537544//2464//frame0
MVASEAKRVEDIYASADKILAKTDNARLFKVSEVRTFPTFRYNEIIMGPKLGKGGFSNVSEIENFRIDVSEVSPTPQAEESAVPARGAPTRETSDDIDGAISRLETSAKNYQKDESAPVSYADLLNEKKEDDVHYHVDGAREFMTHNAKRYGSSRYAIKKLREDLNPVDQARGAIDLAIEIKILSAIWHPNIIKMRGYSETPRVDVNTFLILDRLYGTLEDKMEEWEQLNSMAKGCCGSVANTPAMKDLLKERLLVAYDLSTAFNYLHGHSLLYRDIKPENVGFDVRGDVKLFDFGLCRNLEEQDKVPDGYGYKLTAMTGSIPYMAPEIVLKKPYDREADVYSFAVMLWELMALEWAYNGFLANEYFIRVCRDKHRMPIQRQWPATVRTVIQEGWDPNPEKRPSMQRVGALIRGHLEEITSDVAVLRRTQHLMNRSRRSMHRKGLNASRASFGSQSQRDLRGSRSQRNMYLGGDVSGSEHGPKEGLSGLDKAVPK